MRLARPGNASSLMTRSDPVAQLRNELGAEIAQRLDGWRAADAAVLLRIDRARVSDLRHHRTKRLSLDTLLRIAMRLRIDVRVVGGRVRRT